MGVGLIEQRKKEGSNTSEISELGAIASGYSHSCLSIVYEGEYENYIPFQVWSFRIIRQAVPQA
jgi:hypothetical protein